MLKLTHSKGRLNSGLALGSLLGAVIPIVAVAATGGLATVPVAMWIGLGSVVSGLLAGNVEVKSAAERLIDSEIAKAGRDDE